jgi:predicted porin
MKHTLLAAAAIAACALDTAAAQSTVTLYGIVDAALVRESGGSAGAVTKVTSGAASASRIGFKGQEDLGGGLSAIFTLETGTKIDTGALDAANTLFNRQAFVGLKGKAGTLTVGRQYTPYHNALVQVADPFGTGYAGTSKNLFPDSGSNVRTSNTIVYAAPGYHGWTGDIAWSTGEQAGDAEAGRQMGASLGYGRGPFNVRFAYNYRNSDTAAAGGTAAVRRGTGTNRLLAANYDLGFAKLFAAWGIDKGINSAPLGNPNNPYGGVAPTPSTDGSEVLLGLQAPLARGTLMASVMRKNDRTAFDQDASSWGVGYLYPLSKRSSLYAAYARISNRNGAGYTVANNSESGTGSRAWNLGMRHSF